MGAWLRRCYGGVSNGVRFPTGCRWCPSIVLRDVCGTFVVIESRTALAATHTRFTHRDMRYAFTHCATVGWHSHIVQMRVGTPTLVQRLGAPSNLDKEECVLWLEDNRYLSISDAGTNQYCVAYRGPERIAFTLCSARIVDQEADVPPLLGVENIPP